MTAEVASTSDIVFPAMALRLDNRPHAVTLVRAALSALAERLEIDAELLDDMKTSISEACNNVVMHAYPGERGMLGFELFLTEDAVTAVVRDRGIGLDIRAVDSGGVGPDAIGGVGIPVIRALASEAQFERPAGGGTEVRMTFATERDGISLLEPGTPAAILGGEPPEGGDVVGSISPITLLPPVLGRLARALAAGARFSLDRFSDVYLVTDAIGALLDSDGAGDRVSFDLIGRDRRLELRVGPLARGCTERIRELDATGARPSPLVSLTDSFATEEGPEDTEELRVVLVDRRESA